MLDYNEDGITILIVFVDNLNVVVPYGDSLLFCNTFKKLAADYKQNSGMPKARYLLQQTADQ